MANELWEGTLQARIALWEKNKQSVFNGCQQVTHWSDLVTWSDDDMTQEQILSTLGVNPPRNTIEARSRMNAAWNTNERLQYVAYKSLLKTLTEGLRKIQQGEDL